MKNIVSLIDTNVIINFITKRDDPYKDEKILLHEKDISGISIR